MIVFIILLGLLCLYRIGFSFMGRQKLSDSNQIFSDYISVEKSNAIKGVFIVIVFLSHSTNYFNLSDSLLNTSFDYLMGGILAQSMVAPFMFYSGYGVMLSIDKKGDVYIKAMPKNRILKVLLHFDLAVLLFLILQTILGQRYSLSRILLSLIGWEALGNSSWYIFDILCLYFISWLSFLIIKKKKTALILTFALFVVLILGLYQVKNFFWYDTIMCYFFGMLYYFYKKPIEKFFNRNQIHYWLVFSLCVVLLLVSFVFRRLTPLLICKHIFFVILIVMITMKVSISNKVLCFFGKHLFSIYILERLPMIVLSHFGFSNPYLFVVISFVITIFIAVPFDTLLSKADQLLFKT